MQAVLCRQQTIPTLSIIMQEVLLQGWNSQDQADSYEEDEQMLQFHSSLKAEESGFCPDLVFHFMSNSHKNSIMLGLTISKSNASICNIFLIFVSSEIIYLFLIAKLDYKMIGIKLKLNI